MTATAPCPRCGQSIRDGFVCLCSSYKDPRTAADAKALSPHCLACSEPAGAGETCIVCQLTELELENARLHGQHEADVEELATRREVYEVLRRECKRLGAIVVKQNAALVSRRMRINELEQQLRAVEEQRNDGLDAPNGYNKAGCPRCHDCDGSSCSCNAADELSAEEAFEQRGERLQAEYKHPGWKRTFGSVDVPEEPGS